VVHTAGAAPAPPLRPDVRIVPAFGSFTNAYEAMRDGDRDHAMGATIAGLGFTVLSAAFLLDLDLGRPWPVALIVVGIGLLVSRRSAS